MGQFFPHSKSDLSSRESREEILYSSYDFQNKGTVSVFPRHPQLNNAFSRAEYCNEILIADFLILTN